MNEQSKTVLFRIQHLRHYHFSHLGVVQEMGESSYEETRRRLRDTQENDR